MIARRGFLGATLLIGAAGKPPTEPNSYRTDKYGAPTPMTLNGTPALTTAEASRLWKSGRAIFVDTLARPPRPAGLPAGTLWHPKPRDDIPGSIWLPDTGYGALPAIMEGYFATALRTATKGDRDRTLVFYCRANCWMSWNAARRAATLGYANIRWYRDGTDGWATHGLPLQQRDPVPRPPQ